MVDTLRMQRQHPRLNPRAAEEFSFMIKEHFIVIRISMVKRDAQRFGIAFQRPWGEGGYETSAGSECSVDARRQMVAGTRDRSEITHIQLGHPQISLPSDHVHWIERVDHPRRTPLSFDVDLPCLGLRPPRFYRSC